MTEFFAMGGYAAYVWPAYGFAALVLIALLVQSWRGGAAPRGGARAGAPRRPSRAGRAGRSCSRRRGRERPRWRRDRRARRPSEPMRLRKQQRLILVVIALLLLGGASGLVLFALSDSVAFFVTPSDIATGKVDADKRFRLGGLVVAGQRRATPATTASCCSALTDQAHEVPVRYRGILPDLFREGQGIVAQGELGGGRRVHGERGARQARRELHAARGRRGAEAGRRLAAHRPGRGVKQAMIVEIGHYALVLAFGLALVQGTPAAVGRRARRRRSDRARPLHGARPVRVRHAWRSAR